MRASLLAALLLLLGCAEPAARPIAPVAMASAPSPISRGPSPDAAPPDAPVGAMAIPDEVAHWLTPPLDQIDTTVTIDELQAIRGWRKARRNNHRGGEVWLALHVDDDGQLALKVVGGQTGIVRHYPLGTAGPLFSHLTHDGDTYPSRQHTGEYEGPIVFAIRVLPRADADEAERRQLAVWADGATLKAAERWPGAGWTPLLQVRFRRGTTFRGIGTLSPH